MPEHSWDDPVPHLTLLPSGGQPDEDRPPVGDRWSTWDGATKGPHPRPSWVVTDGAAVDTDLGVLKTGKEADVHVVRREVPGTDRVSVLAAKRFRDPEHRLFHRDAGYLEGRRVRKSRETRAMARRTSTGKAMIAGLWAAAEFEALSRFWALGLPVPYPVQLAERELLMELVKDDPATPRPVAAPRLVSHRGSPAELEPLFDQVRDLVVTLAREGFAHGDLSPYNILVRHGEVVVIDWPQVVDVVGNPRGFEFLERDCLVLARWFTRRGLAVDADTFFGDAAAEVAARW